MGNEYKRMRDTMNGLQFGDSSNPGLSDVFQYRPILLGNTPR